MLSAGTAWAGQGCGATGRVGESEGGCGIGAWGGAEVGEPRAQEQKGRGEGGGVLALICMVWSLGSGEQTSERERERFCRNMRSQKGVRPPLHVGRPQRLSLFRSGDRRGPGGRCSGAGKACLGGRDQLQGLRGVPGSLGGAAVGKNGRRLNSELRPSSGQRGKAHARCSDV